MTTDLIATSRAALADPNSSRDLLHMLLLGAIDRLEWSQRRMDELGTIISEHRRKRVEAADFLAKEIRAEDEALKQLCMEAISRRQKEGLK